MSDADVKNLDRSPQPNGADTDDEHAASNVRVPLAPPALDVGHLLGDTGAAFGGPHAPQPAADPEVPSNVSGAGLAPLLSEAGEGSVAYRGLTSAYETIQHTGKDDKNELGSRKGATQPSAPTRIVPSRPTPAPGAKTTLIAVQADRVEELLAAAARLGIAAEVQPHDRSTVRQAAAEAADEIGGDHRVLSDAEVLARSGAGQAAEIDPVLLKPPLPKLTPEQVAAIIQRGKERPWAKHKKEYRGRVFEFVRDTYPEWVGKGIARAHITKADSALYQALSKKIQRDGLPDWLATERVDLLDYVSDPIARAAIERHRLLGRARVRRHRARIAIKSA